MSDELSPSGPAQGLGPSLAKTPRPLIALLDRLKGPGGLYNLGNILGLAGGLWLAVSAASAEQGASLDTAAQAAMAYLAGNGSAVALTLATLIFMWSGEVYHRAWAADPAPDRALNREGDLLSALGALVLGIALALLGHPILAATAGLLHALGKLGSALHRAGTPALPGWPATWPDAFRVLVLLSRVPAVLIALAALASPGTLRDMVEPAILLVCYACWAKADLMLFRS